MITSELDHLDQLGAKAFAGFLVRKDLVRKYSRQYPVPTYVVEFLLGRYCASTDPAEIEEGLQIVEKQLKGRTVRTGEEELFKARSRDQGSVKIIDIVRARLDTRSDSYMAEVPSLAIKDAQIDDDLVRSNERMLTDGFYAEVMLEYDPVIAQERNGRPFRIAGLRPIQMSNPNVLGILAKGRAAFTTNEWRDFLIRSIGIEPTALNERAKMVVLLRMAPFVERNFNLVELGPRGTGKSHLFQQISPYSHLISGGKATVAKMFVNNGNGQRGLVCQYDVVCFDEVAGVSFDQKDGVNILKGYMASGEFSRGKESIRADGGIVMVGNFDVDVEQQQRIGHLLSPLPREMRDDTAFQDRIHAYAPGWDFPKLNPNEHLSNHFGLVSDFLSECWSRLRDGSRLAVLQNRIHLGGALSGRHFGLVSDFLSECWSRLRDGSRLAVLQNRIHLGGALSGRHIDGDPLPPGQVWAISPGTGETGPSLYRIEVAVGPGSGVKILNQPVPPAFRESTKVGEQNLYGRAKGLVGDRDPRGHEFSIQLRAMDNDRSGAGLGLPVMVSMVGGLLDPSLNRS
ncbi:MAG: BREX system Lon protease-like protein BrxL [Cyanobium sp. 49614_E6]|nr:BREX system Lon protease-like protein BrxL [Cyanobium sp. 49614_E6]